MTRDELMKKVGKKVKITFFDGNWREGVLGYTKEFSAEYGYRKPGYFTIGDLSFKAYHIRKIITLK